MSEREILFNIVILVTNQSAVHPPSLFTSFRASEGQSSLQSALLRSSLRYELRKGKAVNSPSQQSTVGTRLKNAKHNEISHIQAINTDIPITLKYCLEITKQDNTQGALLPLISFLSGHFPHLLHADELPVLLPLSRK